MEQFLNLDSIVAGLAVVYLITLCANWDTTKRTYNVCLLLFIINYALVVANVVNKNIFLSILWIICLAFNGSELRRKR